MAKGTNDWFCRNGKHAILHLEKQIYQEKGIYLWDIIAGAAIVRSAGGTAEISNYRENFQVDVVFSNSKVE